MVEEIVTPIVDLQKSSLNKPVTPPTKEESEDDVEEEELIDEKVRLQQHWIFLFI